MATNRKPAASDRRRKSEGATRSGPRRTNEAPPAKRVRRGHGSAPAPGRESRPQNTASSRRDPRAVARPVPPKNTKQAKARAKARKAKAPKVVRVPLRERLVTRLVSVDLRPRTLAAKIPFVVLIIGALGVGLGITLWLSTDAAERSYQLGSVRERNRVLLQQKEALERDVLTAESAPALAESARELGMIPSRDTAHLVQDPAGNWVVVGVPKPAEGVPPPPLNTKLPDDRPAPAEVPVRMPAPDPAPSAEPGMPRPGPQVLQRTPDGRTTLGVPQLPAMGVPGMPLTLPGMPGMPQVGPPPGPGLEIPPVALPPVEMLPPEAALPPPPPPEPAPVLVVPEAPR